MLNKQTGFALILVLLFINILIFVSIFSMHVAMLTQKNTLNLVHIGIFFKGE